QGYLIRNEIQAARAQCEDVLRFDVGHAQAQQLLSQIATMIQRMSSALGRQEGAGTGPAPTSGTPGGGAGQHTASGAPATDMVTLSNTSGGNSSIMGNMGSAGNFGGGGNPGSAMAATNMAG